MAYKICVWGELSAVTKSYLAQGTIIELYDSDNWYKGL